MCTWPGLILQKPSATVDRLGVVQHINKMIRGEFGEVLVGGGVLPHKNAVSSQRELTRGKCGEVAKLENM